MSVTVCKRKRKKNRKQSGRKASAIPAWRSERFITADSVISTSFPRVEFSSFEKRILSYVNLYTSVGIIRQSQYRREWPLEKRWNATVTIHPFSWPHAHRSKFLYFHASSYDRFTRNYTIRLLVQAARKTFLGDWKRFQEDFVLDGCFRRLQRSTDFEGIWTVRKQPEPVLPVTRAILIRS